MESTEQRQGKSTGLNTARLLPWLSVPNRQAWYEGRFETEDPKRDRTLDRAFPGDLGSVARVTGAAHSLATARHFER